MLFQVNYHLYDRHIINKPSFWKHISKEFPDRDDAVLFISRISDNVAVKNISLTQTE
tara:strand:+ start:317 stop:487 length:171 start_codon:yes stop_codon:yes gene_type:complete